MNPRKLLGPAALAVLAVIIFLPGFLKIQDLKDRNTDLLDKNKRLQAENLLLERELERIDKDKLYQEKLVREKMGVVRKDEIPVKMIPLD